MSVNSASNEVTVEVCDNGKQMDEEVLQAVGEIIIDVEAVHAGYRFKYPKTGQPLHILADKVEDMIIMSNCGYGAKALLKAFSHAQLLTQSEFYMIRSLYGTTPNR